MRRRLTAALVTSLLVAGCSGTAPARSPGTSAGSATAAAGPGSFTNPVLGQGADPFLTVLHGHYYYVQSSQDGHGVTLRSSASLATLQSAPEQRLVTAGEGGPCCEFWAPEIHQIDGRWYLYVAADNGDNNRHRTYVWESRAVDGPYRYAGELQLPGNRWAIDSTIFSVGGNRRFVAWSGWPTQHNGEQDIYLAELTGPTTTRSPAVKISTPQFDWETHAGSVGVRVNEAPAVLIRNGKVYLTYSASGCWTPDYALGLLTANATADLLQPGSWRKSARPVFQGGSATGVYGTGHNGFFPSPDGTQTWMAYHAVTTPAGSCGSDREVYAQQVVFAADGTPQFGVPSGITAPIPLPAGDPGH